ncbi:MAG: hypothetical protein K6B40_08985 [Firmicutes bacterium]|nr:hypothetical protein [Bacillota bacterium]
MHMSGKGVFRCTAALLVAGLLLTAGCGGQTEQRVGGAQEDSNNITIYGYIRALDDGAAEIDRAEWIALNDWQSIDGLDLDKKADAILGGYLYNPDPETRIYPLAADCTVTLYAGRNGSQTPKPISAGLQQVKEKTETGLENIREDMTGNGDGGVSDDGGLAAGLREIKDDAETGLDKIKDKAETGLENITEDSAANNSAAGGGRDSLPQEGGMDYRNDAAATENGGGNDAAAAPEKENLRQDMSGGALAQLKAKAAAYPRIPYRICIRNGQVRAISECQYFGH